jgi:cystathionine beta-lyase family protein involved in aluminum resistance
LAFSASTATRGVIQVHHLEAVAGHGPVDLGDGEIDAVLHAGAFRQHRALHRPRGVEAQLALGARLRGGVTGGGESGNDDGDRGDPGEFHG